MTSHRALAPQAPLSEQGSLHWPRMHDLSMVQSESDWHALSNYNLRNYLMVIIHQIEIREIKHPSEKTDSSTKL